MVHTIVEDSGPAERAETTRLIAAARQSKNHAVANHFILLTERLRFERGEVARLEGIINARDYEDAYGEDA